MTRAFFLNRPHQFVHAGLGGHALDQRGAEAVEAEPIRDAVADRLADEYRGALFLVEPFEPRCQIHAVAEHCVLHAFQ